MIDVEGTDREARRLDAAGIRGQHSNVRVMALCQEIIRLRKINAELESACRMALDSWTIGAEEYEQKYYPYAGPVNLTDKLKKAIENSEAKSQEV